MLFLSSFPLPLSLPQEVGEEKGKTSVFVVPECFYQESKQWEGKPLWILSLSLDGRGLR